jgi:hypothetical protein
MIILMTIMIVIIAGDENIVVTNSVTIGISSLHRRRAYYGEVKSSVCDLNEPS